MNSTDLKRLLKLYGLTITVYRLNVLQIFSCSLNAIASSEIEQSLSQPADRVTLYRTIKIFEETNLIHRIVDMDGIVKFALSHYKNTEDRNRQQAQHLHFNCKICKKVYCLDSPAPPEVAMPATYDVHSLNITIIGICSSCNSPKDTY